VKLPPVSALVINKNQFVVTLRSSGTIGSKLKYSINPKCSFINVMMSAKVTRTKSRPQIKSTIERQNFNLIISGGLGKRMSKRSYVLDINNPPLYSALLLKERLQDRGIKVLGKADVGKTPLSASHLASSIIQLDNLIALINKNSDNYMAECLFKNVGAYNSGLEGNSFYATQAILSLFNNSMVIDDATAIVDGSGISRHNTITTSSIVKLMQWIFNNEKLYEDFYRSLAISGIDGTLQERPIDDFIRGNFRGKTGTLNGVTALSGYLTAKNNHIYIISIIMEYKTKDSNYHKEIENNILIELVK